MKTLRYILFLLLLLPVALTAQINKNLSYDILGKIDFGEEDLSVKPGEFKVNFYTIKDDKIVYNTIKNYDYVVLARNKEKEVKKVFMRNKLKNFNEENSRFEILRAGYKLEDLVYIKESNDPETYSKKYELYEMGNVLGPYDKIHELLPNGLIYKNRDMYTFKKYEAEVADIRNFCILEKEIYKRDTIKYMLNNNIIAFAPKDSVDYYTSTNGNYYLVYNDSRMDKYLAGGQWLRLRVGRLNKQSHVQVLTRRTTLDPELPELCHGRWRYRSENFRHDKICRYQE